MTPAPARAATTGERLTREIIRAQAMKDATPVWGGGFEDGAASPMVMMGNAKAASQTYNAGALFTNNATASMKG